MLHIVKMFHEQYNNGLLRSNLTVFRISHAAMQMGVRRKTFRPKKTVKIIFFSPCIH